MSYTDTRSKLLGHLDRLHALNEGSVAPPINVEIDLCNRCSLGCDWCHFAHTHTRGPLANRRSVEVGDLMDTALAEKILSELAVYGVRSVTWTGGGEPTLHPDYLAIMEVGYRQGLDQGLYTNGCHITSEAAKRLANDLEWAYVSLDEPDRASYEQSKGVDRLYSACRGVTELAAAGLTVGAGFLLHADNYRRTGEMIDLAASLGASYVQFRPAIEFDAALPAVPTGFREWAKALDIRDNGDKIPVDFDATRFKAYANWSGHGYNTCLWSGLQTVITPDGRVWTCCNKRGEVGESLGDLSKEPFEAIWGRRWLAPVNGRCRVMCRGHVGNQALYQILSEQPHRNFV